MKLSGRHQKTVKFLRRGLGAAGLCLTVSGCSRGPAAIEVPDFDPAGSTARAMELYDKDGDGFIAGEELESAPGIKASLKSIDANNDTKASADEVAARLAKLASMTIGLTNINCQVTLDGTPLDGATVTFVPEEFMLGAIQEASDVTGMTGAASPSVPQDKRPSPQTPPGIQLGIYQVVISKKQGDKELVPSKYNAETILGQQVAPDDPSMSTSQIKFSLVTR